MLLRSCLFIYTFIFVDCLVHHTYTAMWYSTAVIYLGYVHMYVCVWANMYICVYVHSYICGLAFMVYLYSGCLVGCSYNKSLLGTCMQHSAASYQGVWKWNDNKYTRHYWIWFWKEDTHNSNNCTKSRCSSNQTIEKFCINVTTIRHQVHFVAITEQSWIVISTLCYVSFNHSFGNC